MYLFARKEAGFDGLDVHDEVTAVSRIGAYLAGETAGNLALRQRAAAGYDTANVEDGEPLIYEAGDELDLHIEYSPDTGAGNAFIDVTVRARNDALGTQASDRLEDQGYRIVSQRYGDPFEDTA